MSENKSENAKSENATKAKRIDIKDLSGCVVSLPLENVPGNSLDGFIELRLRRELSAKYGREVTIAEVEYTRFTAILIGDCAIQERQGEGYSLDMQILEMDLKPKLLTFFEFAYKGETVNGRAEES